MRAKKLKAPLFTIGYERAKLEAVLHEVVAAKVDILVDVRAVAASRRPGFSKRQLAAGLDAHGMAYLHLRALGTPKEGRLAARGGDLQALFRIFQAHLKTPPAQEELEELTSLVRSGRRICLLCYERDAALCHRRRICQLVSERTGAQIEHLAPALFSNDRKLIPPAASRSASAGRSMPAARPQVPRARR
jgi:uncharacterized protein (DUF488 family)